MEGYLCKHLIGEKQIRGNQTDIINGVIASSAALEFQASGYLFVAADTENIIPVELISGSGTLKIFKKQVLVRFEFYLNFHYRCYSGTELNFHSA